MPLSPMPFWPSGWVGSRLSTWKSLSSISGMPGQVGTWYSVIEPLRTPPRSSSTSSSPSANPMPCAMPPWIWVVTMSGFSARPTSSAEVQSTIVTWPVSGSTSTTAIVEEHV